MWRRLSLEHITQAAYYTGPMFQLCMLESEVRSANTQFFSTSIRSTASASSRVCVNISLKFDAAQSVGTREQQTRV